MRPKRIKALIKKDILLDWKERTSLAGILIYVASTVFVCYLSFKRIVDVKTFNALFWIIALFTSISIVTRSFSMTSKSRFLYLYSLVNPKEVILGKMIFNSTLLLLLTLVTFGAYTLFLGSPVKHVLGFMSVVCCGAIGLSVVLTLMAAISAKSANNPTLMAILSFPVILPFLITTITLSLNFAQGVNLGQNIKYFLVLFGIITLSISMGYLLFPYLWRD